MASLSLKHIKKVYPHSEPKKKKKKGEEEKKINLQITEEGVLLTGDPIFGEVFVQMTPTTGNVFPGVPMLVYYDGVMTMSLPGKVNARYVVVPELTGVVSEKDGAGFTLTCKGDSMINARIFDGDIVYIRQQPEVENGQIAAVLIGSEATLKRVYKHADKLVLNPENPAYEPLVLSGAELEDVKIIGKAVAFISAVR